MSGASQAARPRTAWWASNCAIRLCARRRFGVTTVMRAAWPSPRRANRSDFEISNLSLENRGDAHSARGANGDKPAPRAALGELLGERRHDARAGGGERMADGDARAFRVELRAVDGAERAIPLETRSTIFVGLPRLQRAEDLRSEGLVDLVDV